MTPNRDDVAVDSQARMTLREAARYMGIGYSTLLGLKKRGEIVTTPAVRGSRERRVTRAACDALIQTFIDDEPKTRATSSTSASDEPRTESGRVRVSPQPATAHSVRNDPPGDDFLHQQFGTKKASSKQPKRKGA